MAFTLMVARYLDTGAAAKFFLLFNISTIASICFRWGLDEVIIRRVASSSREERSIVSNMLLGLAHRRVGLWMAFGLVCALSVNVPVVRSFVPRLSTADLLVVSVASGAMALVACAARVDQGAGRTNLAAFLMNVLVPTLSIAGLLAMAWRRLTIDAFDLMLLYGAVALAVYGLVVLRRYPELAIGRAAVPKTEHDGRADRRSANKLGGVVLAQQVLVWGSMLIVPATYGAAAYNGFIVAQKAATLVNLVMLAVNFTLSSRIAALHASGRKDELRKITRGAVVGVLISSAVVSLGVILIQNHVFKFSKIEPDMDCVVVVLLVAQILFSVSAILSLVLSMSHDEGYLLIAQGGVNILGLAAFTALCLTSKIEVACAAFPVAYLALFIALMLRAKKIGAI
ncbi:hypothetical protein [uncultured Caulobacter sp.]|uniref:lipopolysaccharide biosynthesis protein n=1 Tax=uncultured Caulobacter sp. TaxID=158749 RepID=UPI002603A606|nr:hypothetical protein [uncultured Caulobacter sp.]